MSYQYRKEKRLCAHWLLGILTQEHVKQNSFENIDETWAKSYSIVTLREIREKYSQFSMKSLYFAALLLKENNHAELQINNGISYDCEIVCQLAGEDAYLSGYYHIQNRKDLLEGFELRTKWIFTLTGVGISIIALILSLFNTFHSKK